MALSNEDLTRMEKDLEQAFRDVAGQYESLRNGMGGYAGGNKDYRDMAQTLATISLAWLEANREKQIRDETRDSNKLESLPKPLKRSSTR